MGQSEKTSEIVTIEKFGDFLKYFGPLEMYPFPLTNGQNIFMRVKDIAAIQYFICEIKINKKKIFRWFHGNITQQESETLLHGKEFGTFLVRLSASTPGCFTVSKVNKKIILFLLLLFLGEPGRRKVETPKYF